MSTDVETVLLYIQLRKYLLIVIITGHYKLQNKLTAALFLEQGDMKHTVFGPNPLFPFLGDCWDRGLDLDQGLTIRGYP